MTSAVALSLAAPLLLLPVAYALWWADRYRLYPLARFAAVLALAAAAGSWLVAVWAEAASLSGRGAGEALAPPSWPEGKIVAEVASAGRLALVALLVLVFLLARARIDSPIDGVVFGVAAGVGLALPIGWLAAESAPAITVLTVARAWLPPIATSVIVGLAVGGARLSPRWPARVALLAGGLAAAVTGAVAARLAAAALAQPWIEPATPALLAFLALALAVIAEARIATRELAEEARLGVLPDWVREITPRYWLRTRGSWWPRRDERRALSRLLLQLAFRKHQLRRLSGSRATLYSLEVGRLRERARRLLDPSRARLDVDDGGE